MELSDGLIGVIGTLAGTIVGWALVSLTEWSRLRKAFNVKKKTITLELEDLNDILKSAEKATMTECEAYANNEYRLVTTRPSNLNIPITESYYREIYHLLTKNERVNIRTFLANLDAYNHNLDNFIGSRSEKRPFIEHLHLRTIVLMYLRVLIELVYLIKKHGLHHKIDLNSGNILEAKNGVDDYRNKLARIRDRKG
ncbi:hypothetical protein [Arsukibacterium sp.]|uniref:hypothetical protein n=1 Tax=Arsukibacterium sp. TaxID=1977258 RepID=UPI00299D16D2|nr:hypothetical protein [Arsukibacterium sp.]MDX1536393.1 hypothetical protein [Arsukibacterium sp.]